MSHLFEHRRRGLELGSARSAGEPDRQRDAIILARMVGNRAFGRILARTPSIAPPERQLGPGPQLPAGAQMVDLDQIEYTQPGISFTTSDKVSVGRMAAQMKKTGWDVSKPADIVRMSDGRLVSLDHRRLWAAARAGNVRQVSAQVHAETDPLSADTAKRFAIDKRGVPSGTNPVTNQSWKAGDKPKSWGDAVRFRSAVQGFGKAGKQGTIGYNPGVLPGGGVRDPKFPATGSKDPPMRVQPGPLDPGSPPYSGGGTVIKSGNKRTTVPSGQVVQGTIGGGGTRPPGGGTGGGGPNVVVDPSLQTGGATNRVTGGGRGSTPPRGGASHFDEGGHDITAEERAAMAMPSNMIAGQGNWSLLGWLMQKFIFAGFEEAAAKREREHINQQIAAQLEGQAVQTIGLQMRGDIAYAQVTTRTTKGYVSAVELTRLVVSPWFKQDRDYDADVAGVSTLDETHSFAITLHPRVKAWAVELLTNRIKAIDAQLQATGSSEQLRTERDEVVTCRHLTATREVSAFSMLPGTCHKYLPMGTPPPS